MISAVDDVSEHTVRPLVNCTKYAHVPRADGMMLATTVPLVEVESNTVTVELVEPIWLTDTTPNDPGPDRILTGPMPVDVAYLVKLNSGCAITVPP